MKTALKYDKLKDLPRAQQLKTLAGAVAFELGKPEILLDIFKSQALTSSMNTQFKGPAFAANEPRYEVERIKSFLAQKYATSSDNPLLNDIASQFAEFFHTNMVELDMGYTVLFDLVDLRGSTHDHFDIIDTNAGLSWSQRQPGGETKIRRNFSEAKTTISMVEYSDGIGILDQWLQFQQFWHIDDAIAEFRATYFNKMAQMHYGLLTALSASVNQAFSTSDSETANKAAASIIRACISKGYALGSNPTMYAVCSVENVGRLEQMLTAQRGALITAYNKDVQPLAHRIGGIIGTTNIPASDTGWYLVLPGRKMKRGIWKDLTVESEREIEYSAENIVGVGQFNAAIGDTDQVRRCLYV